ncbi:hypothetical protein HG530_014608 [Fusarium avenaceum]|nr:hypothetical protein HG530_014608 [Fusarium avenaceum]
MRGRRANGFHTDRPDPRSAIGRQHVIGDDVQTSRDEVYTIVMNDHLYKTPIDEKSQRLEFMAEVMREAGNDKMGTSFVHLWDNRPNTSLIFTSSSTQLDDPKTEQSTTHGLLKAIDG